MLQKQDLILLLTDIQQNGIDVTNEISKVVASPTIPIDVLKFINDHRELDLTNFYRHIRTSYNQKKSKLYKNIVTEIDNPEDVLTTLAALGLQILLYSNKANDRQLFLKAARFSEIESCLANYARTYDISSCLKLIKLIKLDCKAVESLYR